MVAKIVVSINGGSVEARVKLESAQYPFGKIVEKRAHEALQAELDKLKERDGLWHD